MILMLNGSLKNKSGNSQYFMNHLAKEIRQISDAECKMIQIRDVLKKDVEIFVKELEAADAWVIGVPLYVDGLPAQVVCLMEMLLESYKEEFLNKPVYVVSNLGFYEGEQITHLFDIVENWCVRMGMVYGGGIAIGAGPMIRKLEKMSLKKGFNKAIGEGLEKLARCVVKGTATTNIYAKTSIPRWIYLKAAHSMFRNILKENGAPIDGR